MPSHDHAPVGYVVKRYPRLSETFIVNEILAHEAAGLSVEIFTLRPCCDTHFQEAISRVRAPVTHLPSDSLRSSDFWSILQQAANRVPGLWAAVSEDPLPVARDVWQAAILAQHIVERGIRHLHAHFATTPATVAMLAARMTDITFSFTAHARDIYGPEVRPGDLQRKLAHAAAVVTVSDYNVAHLRRTYEAAAERVTRIYNGLPLDEFTYQGPENRAPIVLAVGRLVEKKGFADLIEACALLDRAGESFHCHIIGAGPLDATLREQIARLRLESCVRLLGPLPRVEVVQHMQTAAAVAAPCVVAADGDRDGLPTVLLEAMALGTPCVSTGVTGIPEIVRHRVTGLLVPERNPRELADALRRLLRNGQLRAEIAVAARALVERSFDDRRNAAALRGHFDTVSAATAPAEVA